MMTSVADVGTPLVQLVAVVQLVLVVPVHDVVCARSTCRQNNIIARLDVRMRINGTIGRFLSKLKDLDVWNHPL
jgi:hypothetical protein